MVRMTPSEAAAVDTVISYIAGMDASPPPEVVRSLRILASSSFNRLHGGWHEDAVRRQWPAAFDDVQQAPAGTTDPPLEPDTPVNPA